MNDDEIIDQTQAQRVGLTPALYLRTLRKNPQFPRAKVGKRLLTKRTDWLALLAPAKATDETSATR